MDSEANIKSPLVHSLPPEILTSVFSHLIPPVDSLICLSLVCRHWANVALSTPDLWHTIHWDTTNNPRRSESALHKLTKIHGLNVADLHILFDALDGLQPEHDHSSRGHFKIPLPNHLESILFRWETQTWQDLLSHLPHLTSLVITLTNTSRIPSQHRLPANHLLHLLSLACPALESLSLGDDIFQAEFLTHTFLPAPSTQPTPVRGPTLPLLELVLPRFNRLTQLRLCGTDTLAENGHTCCVYQPRLLSVLARTLGPRLKEFASYPALRLGHVTHAIEIEKDEGAWREFCEVCTGLETWHFGICETLTNAALVEWGRIKREKLRRLVFLRKDGGGRGGWRFESEGFEACLRGCPGLKELEVWMSTGTEWHATFNDPLFSTLPHFVPNLTTLILWDYRAVTPVSPLPITTLTPLTHLPHLHTLALSSCPLLPSASILSFLRSRHAYNTTSSTAFRLQFRDTAQHDPHRLQTLRSLAVDPAWKEWVQDPMVNFFEMAVEIDFRAGMYAREGAMGEMDVIVKEIRRTYGRIIDVRQKIRGGRGSEPEVVTGKLEVEFFYGMAGGEDEDEEEGDYC
ncbi:hypothetical protein BC936DRAFT_146758 [Jimgerdemannia flammicorona]|uniref:F-box domain-containing protein n=1 Tax=Jimgerdemannia flammicorona TaxID=994334 RepID=A0A433D6W7_9FUNG|nr:hypothetical protein BC936DRAFT_146758 [Jimgerdemannia flammicorona]